MNKFSKRLLVGLTVLGLSASAIVAYADNGDGTQWSQDRMSMHDGADQGKFAEKMKERIITSWQMRFKTRVSRERQYSCPRRIRQ